MPTYQSVAGVWLPLITPFKDGRLDETSLARLVRHYTAEPVDGLILAATGAKGMPLVVEVSVAFSVLIAFIVFGVFLFRMRERFDTVDVSALDRFRGERADQP